ncbi:hypothetical protein [Thermococcus sp. 21S7]|uniref:hypothetical protein n=1 Tax=Thermococcus sp. 21S7 TaxID=1638221 RepID=UPI00143AEC99|nr:hypothetical protein [Thermococcus sp. 21S7]NJE60950.1 hypothetical protein [Thermococcus sp. 21S7]
MKKLHLVGMVMVVLVLIFYFGDFTLARSETHASVQTVGVRNTNATFNEGFCVYPDSPFGGLVASELRARGHRVLTLSAPVECDGQFLAVWVEWVNVSYLPVLSKGHVLAVAIYSSAGDPTPYLKYMNATDKKKALLKLEGTKKPQFQTHIIAEVSDESEGFIALRGYHDYLLRQAAKAIADQVEGIRRGGQR